MRKILLNQKLVWALALWASVISLPPTGVWAMPSDSIAISQSASARTYMINQVMTVLSRPEAQVHLRMMGMNSTQVQDSLSKLNDSELASVASKAEAVKAGGDGLGLVIALLIIVVLVMLIVNLNHKKIVVKDA